MAAPRNTLAAARARSGLSRSALASRVGISRQAYAALEEGRSVPATPTALRLARALHTTVEALFDVDPEPFPQAAPGERFRLVRIGGSEVAVPLRGRGGLLPAHLVAEQEGRLVVEPPSARPAVVVAGCDPALPVLGAALREQRGVDLLWCEAGSREALDRLARGEAHVAGCHLRDEETGAFNRPLVERHVPFPCEVVRFAVWQQGLVVATGNPLQLAGLADLGRPGVRLVNREEGSGSRALLARGLRAAGVPEEAVQGFQTAARGHLAVAEAVAAGLADAGVAPRAAARGLGFVPLEQECYDLVIPRHLLEAFEVRAFLDLLVQAGLRRQVEALGGYDLARMGCPA